MKRIGSPPHLYGLLLLGLLTVCLGSRSAPRSHEQPVVSLQQGQVRGRSVEQPQPQLSNYYAFEGIPYARPPVGERRFKDPEEPDSWSSIKNATTAGSICIQKNLLTQQVTGEEDCLFINVYTAHPPSSWPGTKNPVVVWIHPGAFRMGWGNLDIFRPDDLMRQGVVVVSFNYRLGVMGFLNTEDSQAPGNAGLKDAVMALKWVKNNIAAFGGDSDKVTIFGEGAGGAIVHYLLLAPQLTNGLVHRAVSMSGSALAPWALVAQPRTHAVALHERLAPRCPAAAGPDTIVACLQSVEAAELVGSEEAASPKELALRFWKSPFLPSVEAPDSGVTPFLRADPTQLMREGRFLNVPYITGFVSAEGIAMLSFAGLIAEPTRWADVDKRFVDIFRGEMPPGLHEELSVQRMRHFYFGDDALRADHDTAHKFVQMCTDVFVALSTVSSARLMAQSGASVFVYEFTHESEAPVLKTTLYNASHVPGAAHGEDLTYLFRYAQPGQRPIQDSQVEAIIRNRTVQLLTDFAKDANPTPRHSEHPKWPVYTSQDEQYLDMGTFTIRNHVLGKRIQFWRQLAKCRSAELCELNPVVLVEQGLVRGRRQEALANCTYFSWQGVPYAKPPLGALRFKDAVTPQRWLGIRNALQEGNNCPQDGGEAVVGDEDCLFVNIYTPRRPSWLADSLPVMFWIHGGGFVTGSGDVSGVGPDYLICEDIIFVSINYRLGVLGFLYLEAASPGNVGTKDQVAAQRWVQRNIAAFGGDPRRVTIAGESAGSASVHLHMLSPMSKGLFHQAIAQSGAALNPWAQQMAPVEVALNLAAALNCSADDHEAVVECLRAVPADDLVHAAVNHAATQVDRERMISFTFAPTPDYPVKGVETFLPAPAIELVTNNSHHAIPYLTGFNTRESILHLAYTNFRDPVIAQRVDATWNETVLPDIRIFPNSSTEALQALRQFFMNGEPLSNDTFFPYMDMLTDIGFAEGIYKAVRHMAESGKAPVHLYSFGVEDALNFLKIVFDFTDIPGAAHADDLGYLFNLSFLPNVPAGSTADLARNRIVRMWANYVKTGDPTPIDDPLLGTRWLPYTREDRNYLDITSQLEVKTNLNQARVNFWEQFYQLYANETS